MLTLVKTSDAIPLVSIYEVADKKPVPQKSSRIRTGLRLNFL